MNSVVAAAGITLVLFSSVACGNEDQSSTKSAPAAQSTTGGAVAAKGADNTAQVCAEVERLNVTTPRTLTATMKSTVDVFSSGASEAESTKALSAGLKKVKADTVRWIERTQQQSAVATDPALATAVGRLATELEPLRNGQFTFARMNRIVEKSTTDLAPYCGGTSAKASTEKLSQQTGVGPGRACPAPISFDTAEDWKPEPVAPESDSDIRFYPEGITLLCEIDAKPAGLIGFIRVFSVRDAAPRTALKEVVLRGGKATGVKYQEITVDGQAGLELRYTKGGTPGRAFAVTVPDGDSVVTEWKGLDKEEHQAGLPAYELARSTLSVP